MSFIDERVQSTGLTFDDVLLVPAYSEVLPRTVSTETYFSRNIKLNIPIVSAAMDTVTEAPLAIALAREGGIGVIHKNMTIAEQAAHVRRVKRAENGMIYDPITITKEQTVGDALQLMHDNKIGGIPVIDAQNTLIGIVTNRDLRFQRDMSRRIEEVMTKENIITTHSTELEKASEILLRNKIEKLPVVDDHGKLIGLITYKDITKVQDHPNACKDSKGRLRVAAGIGVTADAVERVRALITESVDAVVIDSSHGHSKNVVNTLKRVKSEFPELDVVVGNIATAEAARYLVEAGADGIKVGIGPGSICTTRIIAGVGAVIGFIPQLIVLFILLGFLEGCGYMARVAFIMDRVFRRFGLSGKSFIPMLIASGCGVPAVMATKTIENEKDRRMTIMTTTMIPCGAKLPIIALVFGALAGGDYEATWWVAPVFYFLGLFAIILSCIILKKFRAFSGEVAPFIMELPQYHLPTVKNVLLSMWERVRSYVVKAGTIIFLSSMVIWFLLNFGFYEGSFGLLDPEVDDYIQYSLMAGLGNLLAWIFAPLGFGNWESTVTSITGLVAKENVVATVGVITSLGEEIGETDPSLWASFAAMLGGSSAAIMAFCAFNLLCAPCFAAIGTIRRQMMSAKWTWAAIGYMCAFAWCVGLMIYQFGGLIAGEIAFGPFTALAVVVAAGMLYLLFRPAAKPKGAGRLEAASKNA